MGLNSTAFNDVTSALNNADMSFMMDKPSNHPSMENIPPACRALQVRSPDPSEAVIKHLKFIGDEPKHSCEEYEQLRIVAKLEGATGNYGNALYQLWQCHDCHWKTIADYELQQLFARAGLTYEHFDYYHSQD